MGERSPCIAEDVASAEAMVAGDDGGMGVQGGQRVVQVKRETYIK